MKINILTAVFLIALRLAIGWHLFYEGAWKEQHADTWSSKGYLGAAKGPGALPARWLAGDPSVQRDGWRFSETQPDAEPDPSIAVIERFAYLANFNLVEQKEGQPVALPAPVNEEWEGYFDRFVKHYGLKEFTDKEKTKQDTRPPQIHLLLCALGTEASASIGAPAGAVQPILAVNTAELDALTLARMIFDRNKAETLQWLQSGEEPMSKPDHVKGSLDAPTPVRLHAYQAKLDVIKALKESQDPFAKARLSKAVEEEKAMREALVAGLDNRTERMKAELYDFLPYDQQRMAKVPDPEVKAKEPVVWPRLDLVNGIVRWGLIITGLCLLLGLLTRPACIAGFLLVLTFYLPAPPAPLGLIDPQAREHFYLVSWNIIESVALLALATTRSGRWFGLDGLLQFLLPWNRRRANVRSA